MPAPKKADARQAMLARDGAARSHAADTAATPGIKAENAMEQLRILRQTASFFNSVQEQPVSVPA
ncbi:MAG: hypothetical protein V9G22_14485 [Ottowia sp.]